MGSRVLSMNMYRVQLVKNIPIDLSDPTSFLKSLGGVDTSPKR